MSYPIRAVELSKRFRGVQALDRVNLEAPEGGVYGLVGPNGAGKTTAIKILMNLIRPTSGRVETLGADARRLSPRELVSIGYVSENQQLPEWMTVEYFLGYLRPFYPAWDDELAAQLVRQLDLPRGRKLKDLSRGMRMKAALAGALAYRPRLIVLDEPFGGLDPLVRDEFIGGLLEWAEGATIFISSHDLAEIETFASHIGYLDCGKLQFSEALDSLAARFREVEVTLEAPAPAPAEWPRDWLQPESSAAAVRFVDTRFDRERTTQEIRHLFPGVRDVSFNPMSLRAIFVALAKSARAAAAEKAQS